MDQAEFDSRLFVWLDGELPAAEAAAMDAFCRADPAAQARADRERAFEARVAKSLLAAGADGPAVVARALAATRPAGKVLRVPRWAAGAAAAAVMAAVSFAWFTCIPPFECPFVSALEEASVRPAAYASADPSAAAADAPRDPCPAVESILRGAGVSVRSVEHMRLDVGGFEQVTVDAVRRQAVAADVGEVSVISFAVPGGKPSCRRKRQVGSETWWVGDEDGHTVVCVPGTCDGSYVAIVGPQTEETLIEFARSLRRSLAPRD